MCLPSCRKYFTGDAWLALEVVIAAIATNPATFVEGAQIQLMMTQKIPFCVTAV